MLEIFPRGGQVNYFEYETTRYILCIILADIIEITRQKTALDEKTMGGMEKMINAINAIKNTPLPAGSFLSPVAGSC